MALIQCPECGRQVSDKAIECPQCKTKLKESEPVKKICLECGEELRDDEQICSKCGCPVPTEEQIKGEAEKKRKKKILKIGILIIAIMLASICIFVVVRDNQKQKTEQLAEEQALKLSQDYTENLSSTVLVMISGAADAEAAGHLIHDVWSDTIYQKYNPETNKYVSGHGDFNDSLQELFDDSEFAKKLNDIKTNQETVKSLMKELTNPPEEHVEAYSELKNFYDAYLELTNLVTNPTGSLQTFTNNFNDADTAVAKYYEAMSIYIE